MFRSERDRVAPRSDAGSPPHSRTWTASALMPIDRAKWRETVTESSFPRWKCRNCDHVVALVKDGIDGPETGGSLSSRDLEAWEPEWIQGRFSAKLQCSNCKDPAFAVGTYEVRTPYDPFDEDQSYAVLRIQGIEPPPALIRLPTDLPDALTVQLERAFRLFWVDGAACANAIRGAVDEFLNYQRVRKTDGSRSNRGRLSLHHRIELFAKKEEHLAAALMAVKWIGNVGSHSAEVRREALCDGFDLLEHVLYEAFETPRKKVAQLARQVTRRKGR